MNISASSMKRAFWFLLAIIFLIENWLWEHVRDWLAMLCRRIGLERFEPWLKTFVAPLSPLVTLLLFGVPALAILPFKIIAVALIARGKITAGLVSCKDLGPWRDIVSFCHLPQQIAPNPLVQTFLRVDADHPGVGARHYCAR